MEDRGRRPAPAHPPGDRNPANGSATERRRDASDQHHHQPGSATAQWRAEGLDFVRDAIRLTYK